MANVRSDNNKVLGVVGRGYQPVQNTEAFEFVDGLVENGEIRYESAGTLKGGRIVWLLAKMPDQIEVTERDVSHQYILFTNGHDGSKAVRVMPTAVRVVCNNTLNLALNEMDRSRTLTMMHTGSIKVRLQEARQLLGLVCGQFVGYGEKIKAMASIPIDRTIFRNYVVNLFPDVDGQNNNGRKKARRAIIEASSDGPQMLDGIRGTAWAALNAVTQYVDHDLTVIRGGKKSTAEKADNRMGSIIFGHGARIKAKAFETALALV